MQPVIGFREKAHTADWELEVWAPDFPALLEQAACGMYALSGVHLEEGPRLTQTLSLSAQDSESLLVQFLSNILWFEENQHLGFDNFDIKILGSEPYHLSANLEGSTIISMDKEIKAVTYHNLAIQTTQDGLRVVLVFDV